MSLKLFNSINTYIKRIIFQLLKPYLMKKRSLKTLKLEKNVISNLSAITLNLKGGLGNTLREQGCPGYSQTSVRPCVCKITCDEL
ncbi:hypothetical protein GCM10022258_01470 [Aquimarina gracilis]